LFFFKYKIEEQIKIVNSGLDIISYLKVFLLTTNMVKKTPF